MSGARPFFSVCVPVYNGRAFLNECLDSIAAQTFGDFEVVVVDDGSRDDSRELVRAAASRDARIVLHENPKNLGLVGNWNRCLELARGAWIKYLFQDDLWDPDCLERVHAACAGRDLVFHNRRFIFSGEVSPALREFYASALVNQLSELARATELSAAQVAELMVKYPVFNFFGEPSSVAFRSELLAHYGRFDERLVQLCDFEFFARIGSERGAAHLPQQLSTFRVHGAATSSSNLETKQFRYRHVDRLIVFDKYRSDPIYAELRRNLAVSAPGALEALYRAQERVTASLLRDLPRAERLAAESELQRLTPWAYPAIHAATRRHLGLWRRRLARLLKR